MSRKALFRRDDKPITPEMRAEHLVHSREYLLKLNWSYARQFPWTYAKQVMAATGLPLEITRWINQNDHRLRAWFKSTQKRMGDFWDKLKIAFYTVPKTAYEIGTEEELRSFVASMREKKTKHGSTYHRGPFFFTEPGDLIINREIIKPGTNGTFLSGAVGLRFDDDFFAFAALPFRFRHVPVETVMSILFPDRPISEYEFLPDSGTPEMEKSIKDQWYSNVAFEMALNSLPNKKNNYDDYKVSSTNGSFVVHLLLDNFVVGKHSFSEDEIKAYKDR